MRKHRPRLTTTLKPEGVKSIMAKANRSKAAQAVKGAKGTNSAPTIGVGHVETLHRKISQALAISILAAADNASDEITHRDASSAVAEILGQALEYLDELSLRAGKVDQS